MLMKVSRGHVRGAKICVLPCHSCVALSGSVTDNAPGKGKRAWRIITGVTTLHHYLTPKTTENTEHYPPALALSGKNRELPSIHHQSLHAQNC